MSGYLLPVLQVWLVILILYGLQKSMNWLDMVAGLDLVGGLLCCAAVLLALRYRDISASKPLALLFALMAFWLFSEGLVLSVSDTTLKLEILKWRYVVATFVPLVWVAVARAVTAAPKANWWQLPFLVSGIFAVLCLITNSHGLILERIFMLPNQSVPKTTYGVLFPAYAVFSYGLLVYGGWLIWRALRTISGVWHFELRLWLLCVIVPTTIDVSSFLPGLDRLDVLTPLALALSAAVASWGLVRRRVFRVQPVALEAAFQSMRDGVVIVDNYWRVARVNSAATFEPGRWIGEPIRDLLPGWRGDMRLNQSLEVKNNERILEYTISAIPSGGFVVVIRDLTALRHYEQQLLEAAMRDPLTQLSNRRAFLEEAKIVLARASIACLVYLDLDGFKRINDRLGHESGDELLVEVAQRYRSLLGDYLLARVGGDEFVALLELPETEVENLMHDLEHQIAQPAFVNGQTVSVGLSWGVAVFPNDGTQLESLMRVADANMYAFKSTRVEQSR